MVTPRAWAPSPGVIDEQIRRESLVVVIPGIGGSVLRDPESGKIVWDGTWGQVSAVLARPNILPPPDYALAPAGVVRDSMRFLCWAPIRGYRPLISALADAFETEPDLGESVAVAGSRVVTFSYDFRQSCVDNAVALDDFVNRRLDALGMDRHRRVIIVAHSMGGVIARTWLANHDAWERCRHLVTLGTPHLGAPKAHEILVNGAPWWTGTRLPQLRDRLRTWPAMYDLLPKYASIVRANDGERNLWKDKLRPEQAWAQDGVEPELAARASEAFDRFADTSAAWTSRAGEVGAAYFTGGGKKTYQYSVLDNGQLRSVKKRCPWFTRDGVRSSGDGTVPEMSTVPLERQRDTPDLSRTVRIAHGEMPASTTMSASVLGVLSLLTTDPLAEYLGAEIVTRGQAPEVDLDIEDAYLYSPGEAEPRWVGFELGSAEEASTQVPRFRIHRSAEPAGAAPVAHGSFVFETGSRWLARLPDRLGPGEYRFLAMGDASGADPTLTTEALFDVFAAPDAAGQE